MSEYPRRGDHVTLDCSCGGTIADWALTPWGSRLFVVELLQKGDRCGVARHRRGRRVSVRRRRRGNRSIYYEAPA
jgi:hypothetical protein